MVVLFSRWFYFQGGPIFRVVSFPEWFYFQGGLIFRVVSFPGWFYFQGGLISGFGLKACIPLCVSVPHSGRRIRCRMTLRHIGHSPRAGAQSPQQQTWPHLRKSNDDWKVTIETENVMVTNITREIETVVLGFDDMDPRVRLFIYLQWSSVFN